MEQQKRETVRAIKVGKIWKCLEAYDVEQHNICGLAKPLSGIAKTFNFLVVGLFIGSEESESSINHNSNAKIEIGRDFKNIARGWVNNTCGSSTESIIFYFNSSLK